MICLKAWSWLKHQICPESWSSLLLFLPFLSFECFWGRESLGKISMTACRWIVEGTWSIRQTRRNHTESSRLLYLGIELGTLCHRANLYENVGVEKGSGQRIVLICFPDLGQTWDSFQMMFLRIQAFLLHPDLWPALKEQWTSLNC